MHTRNRYTKTCPVTWEQLHRDLRTLAWKLIGQREWKGILAVTRGGLVPAAILARELEIRQIETICMASYDWQDQDEVRILKQVDLDGEGWLLVDDLVDTGQTARLVRQMVPKAVMATVYAKPAGRSLVDVTVNEVSQDTWILFPWDSQVAFCTPIAARDNAE